MRAVPRSRWAAKRVLFASEHGAENNAVTVHVLVVLDIYFVSVKYVNVSVELVNVYVKFLKI
jgi:hypothetical protein